MARSILLPFLLFEFALLSANSAQGLAEKTAGPETVAVMLSVVPKPTRRNIALAPTSQLSFPQATVLANAIARLSGRDIVIGTVAPTGSMRPFFDENALLLLEAVPYGELKLGDVVTYFHATRKITIVHRLVEKRGNQFWAKGDWNGTMDNIYVTPENYRRRVAGVIYLQPNSRPADLATAGVRTAALARK